MAQAIGRKTVRKMMTMTMGAKLNHSSSSNYSTFGRIIPHNNQLTTSTKTNLFPCRFSPLTNKNQLLFLHPSSSFGVRQMSSSPTALQKAWVFVVTQRAEAHAKLQETTDKFLEICQQPTLGILESVSGKLFAFAVLYMTVKFIRTLFAKSDAQMIVNNPYHLLLQFPLKNYVDKSKVDVMFLDGRKVCCVYLKHTQFYSLKKMEHKALTYELLEGTYDGAKFVTWFNKQTKSVMVEIFSVKPATKVSLIHHDDVNLQ